MKKSRIYFIALMIFLLIFPFFNLHVLAAKNPNMSTQIAIKKSPLSLAGGNFVVPAGYGWLKVWIYNKGTSVLTVNVTKPSTNNVYLSYKIPPGKQLVIPNYGKATGTGTHWINFSSQNGKVSGYYSILMANNPLASKR